MKRPQPRGLIIIRCDDELSVGTERNLVHRLRMPAKLCDQFSIQRIPHTHGIVRAGRNDKLSIRAEERQRQRSRVTTQLFDELSVRRPESRSAVATAGHDRITVRTETHTRNVVMVAVLVTAETKLHLPGFDVPHGRRVIACRQSAELSAWPTFGRE